MYTLGVEKLRVTWLDEQSTNNKQLARVKKQNTDHALRFHQHITIEVLNRPGHLHLAPLRFVQTCLDHDELSQKEGE